MGGDSSVSAARQPCEAAATLAVPAAATRAAEVGRIGVVSRSTRLASAVSRLFLVVIVSVVVSRAAGLFPGAVVAVAFHYRRSAAAVALPRRCLLPRPLLGWDGVAKIVFLQGLGEDLVHQADGDAGVGNLVAMDGVVSPAVEECISEHAHGAVGDPGQYVSC